MQSDWHRREGCVQSVANFCRHFNICEGTLQYGLQYIKKSLFHYCSIQCTKYLFIVNALVTSKQVVTRTLRNDLLLCSYQSSISGAKYCTVQYITVYASAPGEPRAAGYTGVRQRERPRRPGHLRLHSPIARGGTGGYITCLLAFIYTLFLMLHLRISVCYTNG